MSDLKNPLTPKEINVTMYLLVTLTPLVDEVIMTFEYQTIIDKIKLSNNNKLMVCCFENKEIPLLNEMRDKKIIFFTHFCGYPSASLSKQYLKRMV